MTRPNSSQPKDLYLTLSKLIMPILFPTLVGGIIRIVADARTPLLIALDSVLYYLFALDWKRNFEWRGLLPFRTPVYPMMLGEALRFLGETPQAVTIAQVALGIITIALVSDIARRLMDHKHGLLIGCMCAIYPTLIFFENFLLTETLATTLITTFFWSLLNYETTRNNYWLRIAGLLGGLTALTRPTLITLALTPVVTALFKTARDRLPILIKSLPLYTVYTAMLIVPWIVYVAVKGGTVSLTIATGWQLWIYQHIDQTFDDTVPSFAPYRDRYRQYVVLDPGQASGWMVRGDIEKEFDQNMAVIDQKFLQISMENIARHPIRYISRVGYSTAYFLGLVLVDDQEENEADHLIQRTLSDRKYRNDIGLEYMTTTGYFLPADPRANLDNPFDKWLLGLYRLFRQRGFVLTPLFFVGVTTLLRHKRYPFFCANLLVGVISVTILHSLFLANLDRYHWVMEPIMLAVSTGIVYQTTH